ncbi:uncharacterized protein LOC117180784 [Belonocnema kinseyi]|uniref:uncharacterized protein LOC117180784 n=1 Tax=Belonocnema kinseyi TaxID=2817044 RepID=UPI00143DCC71|nr:uncharacterized protein LOC117180784 [Belonocnema kinseyi]XP_033229175.1 uncharacterized protein LOC117180784 [Belonocnema kinseyi]
MKIFLGSLFIALAVFPDDVQSGSSPGKYPSDLGNNPTPMDWKPTPSELATKPGSAVRKYPNPLTMKYNPTLDLPNGTGMDPELSKMHHNPYGTMPTPKSVVLNSARPQVSEKVKSEPIDSYESSSSKRQNLN